MAFDPQDPLGSMHRDMLEAERQRKLEESKGPLNLNINLGGNANSDIHSKPAGGLTDANYAAALSPEIQSFMLNSAAQAAYDQQFAAKAITQNNDLKTTLLYVAVGFAVYYFIFKKG